MNDQIQSDGERADPLTIACRILAVLAYAICVVAGLCWLISKVAGIFQ